MTEVMMMVPPPRSAPSTRQDIISSILSDYGNLSSHNSPYGSSVHASSPLVPPKTPKDKPLPPLVTAFELRVNDTKTPPKKELPRLKMETSPTGFSHQAITRRNKPRGLTLTKSNGSTAANAPASTSVTSLTSLPNASTSTTSLPSQLAPRSAAHDKSLPALPPVPPARSELRMGSKHSKPSRDLDHQDALNAPKPLPSLFKRRPLPATTVTQASPKETSPPISQSTRPSTPPSRQPLASSEAFHSATDSQSTVTDLASSPPTENDCDGPPTPTILPVQLLPSPSPVPQDTPSKYGVNTRIVDSDAASHTSKSLRSERSLHFRGKSSTGFNLFEKPAAKDIQQSIDPSDSLLLPAPHTPMFSPARLTAIHNQNTPAGPTSATLNTRRPARSNAPALSIAHLNCFQRHTRFHRSRNRFASVACMVCYKDGQDDRYSCAWCCLRICAGCRDRLEGCGRDLSRVLEMEAEKAQQMKSPTMPTNEEPKTMEPQSAKESMRWPRRMDSKMGSQDDGTIKVDLIPPKAVSAKAERQQRSAGLPDNKKNAPWMGIGGAMNSGRMKTSA